jgi:PTS system galactitol-specific IIA component
MLNIVDLIREGQVFHKDYVSQQEYFTDISQYILNLDFVTPEFKQALETREKNYPTGLITKSRVVALPHVDSKYVNKNAVFITCFKNPVSFQRMDDITCAVAVTISFLLLIKDVDLHMKAIQQMISIFQDDLLDDIYKANDTNQVIELIEGRFHESD